jgi:hypothetical protein
MAIKHNQQIPHNRMLLYLLCEIRNTNRLQISARIGNDESEFTSTSQAESSDVAMLVSQRQPPSHPAQLTS